MKIFLVQHGQAKPEAEDPQRGLSAQGEKEIRQMAEAARKLALSPQRIYHSGKLRAEQTARFLAEALGGLLQKGEGLDPKDDPRPWADRLHQMQETVMLVGHLPFLEKLASLLISGEESLRPLLFGSGAINCLERKEDGKWAVRFVLTPEMAAWFETLQEKSKP